MKKPDPTVGLVIRYDFLWSHEREKGYADGAKTRPCVIVTAVLRKATGGTDILVAPITHSPPMAGTVAIEIPHRVGQHLGLDDARSYIIASEANSVSWDDPGIVPVKTLSGSGNSRRRIARRDSPTRQSLRPRLINPQPL